MLLAGLSSNALFPSVLATNDDMVADDEGNPHPHKKNLLRHKKTLGDTSNKDLLTLFNEVQDPLLLTKADNQEGRDVNVKQVVEVVNKNVKAQRHHKHTDEEGKCGLNYCKSELISFGGLKSCLETNFVRGSSLLFPEDKDAYIASMTTMPRRPAALVFVEDVDQVKAALACAVDNGYKVSARGGNHSFQGLGSMDGYVVIDMTRTCKPDEFVIDKEDQGPHILDESKYIGTMRGQAGCTNSVMLSQGHKHFGHDGGLTIIGGCPSVGITGYVLGGGAGGISPYVGLAIDIVKEIQLVLYDGVSEIERWYSLLCCFKFLLCSITNTSSITTYAYIYFLQTVVKASKDENPDLFWASRGGGGGNGIITHITYKIVQAPKQKHQKEKGRKFTNINLNFLAPKLVDAVSLIQKWYYEGDTKLTSKCKYYCNCTVKIT